MKITPNWPSIFRYSSCLSPGRWRWTSSTGQTLWKPFNFKLKDRVSTKLNIDQGTNFTTLRDTTASLVHFHRLTSRSSWSTKCCVKWLTWVKKKILTSRVHLCTLRCLWALRLPSVGTRRSRRRLIKVVFPEPFSPTKPTFILGILLLFAWTPHLGVHLDAEVHLA